MISNKSDIKSIWPRTDPFAKKEPPKEIPKPATEKAVEKNAINDSKETAEQNQAIAHEELLKKGKLPTVVKIVDVSGNADGAVLKVTITARNEGEALARDMKIKCIGNPRLKPVTSPMAPVGDVAPGARALCIFQYEMPANFCEEYANFSLGAECENAKPFSQLFTLKTNRRAMTATEREEAEKAKEKNRGGGKH